MRIAICSDARFPTSATYKLHGLGRSVANLGAAFARHGHSVTVYALQGSSVAGCKAIYSSDEGDILAQQVFESRFLYDVVIDSTHVFKPAFRLQQANFPVVSKICDFESAEIPPQPIYGTRFHQTRHSDTRPTLLIREGVPVDNIPFNPGIRYDHFVCAARKVEWKRIDRCIEVARLLDREITVVGDGELALPQYHKKNELPATPPPGFYTLLMNASAVISAVPSMSLLEAAATGTPSLSFCADVDIAEGVTGFSRWNEIGLVEAVERLCEIQPKTCREWVADNASIDGVASYWETVLQKVIDGERW